jgi:hypothetical protein
LIFWIFIGSFLNCSLDVWSLLQKIMHYKLAFVIVNADVKILWIRSVFVFGSSGSWFTKHAARWASCSWGQLCSTDLNQGFSCFFFFFRVEYLLPIAEICTVGAYQQEVCGSITGVVTLFGHMRCPCKQGQWTIFQ